MASKKKFRHINCADYEPVACISTGGAATGADTSVTRCVAGPHYFEIRNEQANGDIVPLRVVDANSCNGWQIPCDNTDDDGIEMGFGILADADAQHCFKSGTDPAFFFEVKLGIPDVSDYDVCAIGFRTAGAYGDAINSPTNLKAAYSGATNHKAIINVEAGDFHCIKTTNGTDVEEDVAVTNAVDDDVMTLKVVVSAAGVPTYYVDGTDVSASTTITAFDDDDLLVPCMIFCKGANAADTPIIIEHITMGYV